MNNTLSIIKQNETVLKQILIQTYGRFLPVDRVNLLKQTTYTTNDLLNCKTAGELRGKLLRRMLGDVINMNTTKEMTLGDGNTLTIEYGQALESSLINYYAHEIAEKYHFNISDLGDVKDDLETIKALYDKIGNKVDYSAFNEDAVKLLKKADIKEITKKYDDKELQRYITNVSKVAAMTEEGKQQQSDMLNEATNRLDSVQIIWLHNRKHIKYTDPYGKVHLTDIEQAPRVEEYYKERLAKLGPDEKLDPEEFYRELVTYYTDEMELLSTKDVKKDELNSQEVDMLQFIQTNKTLANAREMDITRHNSTMDTHILEGNNSVVATEDKDGYVEANIVKDGQAEAEKTIGEDVSSQLISKEEYIRLNEKLFSQEEELSEEEIEALRRAAPIYAEEVFNETKNMRPVTEGEESGAVLRPYSNKNNTGFTLKTFAAYFVVLTLLIGSFIAILILR